MGLSAGILQALQPQSAISYGNEAVNQQNQQAAAQLQQQAMQGQIAMQPLQMQQARIANQTQQDALDTSRRNKTGELFYRISQLPPDERPQAYQTVSPMIAQLDPSNVLAAQNRCNVEVVRLMCLGEEAPVWRQNTQEALHLMHQFHETVRSGEFRNRTPLETEGDRRTGEIGHFERLFPFEINLR